MASQSPWSVPWKRITHSPIKLPNSSSSSFSSSSSVIFAYRTIHRKQTHLTAFSFEDPSASSSSPPRVCCCGHNAGKRMRKSVNKKPEKGGEEVSSVDRPRSRKRSATVSLKSLFGRQSLWRRIVFASTKVRSIILLNVITVVYASNIPVVKEVEAIMDPAAFNVVRFAVSAIPFIPFVLQARGDAQTRNAGIELGFWLSLGYLMQALGLLTSDAGRASFISMFTVIVVPLLDGMLGSIVPTRTWFGALMSIVGVAMLESSGSPPNVGDLLNFLSAIFFGIHMLRTEHISRSTAKENFLPLLGYEVCVVAISSTLWYILGAWFGDVEGGNPSSWTWTMFWDWMVVFPWIPALYTGIFSTGLCLWVESMANAVVLLCKRGNSTCGILFSRDMTFQLLVKKLLGKWNDLIEGSFSLSFSLRGHPNCFLDSQDDLDVLGTLAVALGISSVDVVVRDLAGGSCSDSTVVDASSSSSKGSGSEVVLLCAATTEVDLLPTFIHHETKVLKSAPWVDVLREVGQVFVGGVVSFRDSLCKYSLYHGFKFDYVRNDAQTVKANCSQRLTNRNCLWSIKAKLERHSGHFWIKEFNNVHTCGSDALSSSSSRASSRLIGRLISDEIRVTPSKRPFEFLQDMKMDFGVDVSYRKVWMGVEKARGYVFGDYTTSFNDLLWYIDAAKSSNPSSIFDLESDASHRFTRLFVGFDACKYGFNFCRPVLFVDATFLKGTHKGCVLAACAKDGNQGLYPICFAVVDCENGDNWLWFMEKLKVFLDWEREVVFVSDRHGGLLKAVETVFPSAPHSYCLFHLKANLRKALGGMETKRKKHLLNLFGLCAYVPTVSQFDALLTQLKEEGGDRVQCFLQNLSKEHWCHAHFPGKRYSELTSNIVECFNSWIRKERRLPIRDLVDKIRIKVMEKMSVRRDLAMKWKCDVCPEMDRRITQLFKESRAWTVKKSSDSVYEVQCHPSVKVDMVSRNCSCREWQINCFPCVHATCVGKHIGKNLKEYVDRYYLVDSYREAYSKSINPIPTISKAGFVAENDNVLLPPLCKRPPGRPRTERIPLTGVQVRKVKCGRCGKTGHHNRATCTEPLVV